MSNRKQKHSQNDVPRFRSLAVLWALLVPSVFMAAYANEKGRTPTQAEQYKNALELRERMEKALADEFQNGMPDYEAMIRQERARQASTSSQPVESTKDTVFLVIPQPIVEVLLQQWGDTVAVSTLENGWKQIFLATPDNAKRRMKLAQDIAKAMEQEVSIPPGTDRLLISPSH